MSPLCAAALLLLAIAAAASVEPQIGRSAAATVSRDYRALDIDGEVEDEEDAQPLRPEKPSRPPQAARLVAATAKGYFHALSVDGSPPELPSKSPEAAPSVAASGRGDLRAFDEDGKAEHEVIGPAAALLATGVPGFSRLKSYEEFDRAAHPPNSEDATAAAPSLKTPSDAVHALAVVPRCTWQSAVGLAVLLFVAMSPIGIKQGWRPFVAVLAYISCLTLVKILVKLTLRSGMPYPYSLTTVHVVVTAAVASCFDRPQLKEALRVLPISLANSGALAFSNTALVFSGVAFVSMLSCCTPASTCAVEILTRRKEAAWQTGAAVLIVCTGGMLCVRGEKDFSLAAILLTALSSVCRSLKCIWQHEQLQMALSPYRMVAWSGIWSLVLMVPLVAHYEGWNGFNAMLSASDEGKAAALASVVVAVILNLVQCSALQYLGPLIQHVVGNLQLLMAIVLASLWLHEEVTLLQWGGVLLLVLGTMVVKASPERTHGKANIDIKLPAPDNKVIKNADGTSGFPRPWLSPAVRPLSTASTVPRTQHRQPFHQLEPLSTSQLQQPQPQEQQPRPQQEQQEVGAVTARK